MATFETFEEIKAWQRARELTRDLYQLFKTPALRWEFVLRDQLTRASLPVMNNIAEGFGRYSPKDFARFLTIAKASATEVQSMLYVLHDLRALDEKALAGYSARTNTIIRMIGGLAAYLRGEGAGGPMRTQNSELGTQN